MLICPHYPVLHENVTTKRVAPQGNGTMRQQRVVTVTQQRHEIYDHGAREVEESQNNLRIDEDHQGGWVGVSMAT